MSKPGGRRLVAHNRRYRSDPGSRVATVRGCGQRPYSEVEAWRLPFGLVSFGLAFGDLPGDPSSDITAGWGRTQRVNVVGGCRSGMVDSGDLGRTTVERGGKPIEGILAVLVGEVGALLISQVGGW